MRSCLKFPNQIGKNFGNFIVIPNTEADNKKDENRPFWLRIFASEYIDVEELPESMEVSMRGTWGEDNAGGPRKLIEEKNGKKQEFENPYWCKNPQYFINIKLIIERIIFPNHLFKIS